VLRYLSRDIRCLKSCLLRSPFRLTRSWAPGHHRVPIPGVVFLGSSSCSTSNGHLVALALFTSIQRVNSPNLCLDGGVLVVPCGVCFRAWRGLSTPVLLLLGDAEVMGLIEVAVKIAWALVWLRVLFAGGGGDG